MLNVSLPVTRFTLFKFKQMVSRTTYVLVFEPWPRLVLLNKMGGWSN